MHLLPIWLGMQRSQTLSQISNVSASSGQTHSTASARVFIIRLLFTSVLNHCSSSVLAACTYDALLHFVALACAYV